MSIEEKWGKLRENEKNNIIVEKILEETQGLRVYTRIPKEFRKSPNEDAERVYNKHLNWTGFGKIVDKAGCDIELSAYRDNCGEAFVEFWFCTGDHYFKVYGKTPWDAAAIAYLEMKKIEV